MTQAASGARGGYRPPGALALPIAHYADNETSALHNQPTSGPYIVSAFSTFALGSEIKRGLPPQNVVFPPTSCVITVRYPGLHYKPDGGRLFSSSTPTNVHYCCKTGNNRQFYFISKLTGKSTSVTYNYDSIR